LNKAKKEWGWLDSVPHIRKFSEPKKRLRWLTREEVDRLFLELPEHTRAMAAFSLATGLRESNVTHLEWSQIDLQRQVAWVHTDQAKGGKAIGIPLNEEAITILRQQLGKHHSRVFTYKGNSVEKVSTKVLKKALILFLRRRLFR
jgi:integrase